MKSTPVLGRPHRAYRSSSTALFYTDYPTNNDDKNSNNNAVLPSMERIAAFTGVSVSPEGFQLMLEMATSGKFLTVPITLSGQDDVAATSAESLTIIQLLNGVDMGGMVLPPETLSRLVVLHCEEKAQDARQQMLMEAAGDPEKARAFLLERAMINCVRDSEAVA